MSVYNSNIISKDFLLNMLFPFILRQNQFTSSLEKE